MVLRRAALDVRTVGTVEEARAADAIAADLILLDLHLNGEDGLQLANEFASSRKQIPIVVVSSSVSKAAVQERVRIAGCAGFIAKPIDPRSFAAEVTRYLRIVDAPAGAAGSESQTDSIALHFRRQFLDAALQTAEELMARSADRLFSDTLLAEAAHRWAGASSIDAETNIQDLAHELELLARAKQLDTTARIRDILRSVRGRFQEARPAT